VIHTGDCIEVMRGMEVESVDAIVTDPPYGLSSHRKSTLHCLQRILANVGFPDNRQGVAEDVVSAELALPRLRVPTLDVVDGSAGIGSGIGVPEGAVDLEEHLPLGQPEVGSGDEPASSSTNGDLPNVDDLHAIEDGGNYILQFGDGIGTQCEGACRCFTQPSASLIRVLVRAPSSTGGPRLGANGLPVHDGDPDVRTADDALGEPQAAASVVAGARAIRPYVLALDLGRRTGELLGADRTGEVLAPAFQFRSIDVGAGPGTGGAPPEGCQPVRVVFVEGTAHRALTLWLPTQLFTSDVLGHSTKTGGFMNKHWDGLGSRPEDAYRWHLAWAREAFRVLRPGGYILAFGGTRTVHRLGCALEDAGFIPRDLLVWITASGFPKGKANLKPAHEPIVLARKPGPLRPLAIDECRIGYMSEADSADVAGKVSKNPTGHAGLYGVPGVATFNARGRWPSNVLLEDAELFDEPNPYVVGSGASSEGFSGGGVRKGGDRENWRLYGDGEHSPYHNDSGGYSRFFIIPKADRADREPVVRGQVQPVDARMGLRHGGPGEPGKGSKEGYEYRPAVRANSHPTVKPTDLMRHLVRLVTPQGGTVLDPFLGSGSTAIACELEGFPWVGIEKEPEYVAIAEARLNGTQRGLGLDVGAPVRSRKVGPDKGGGTHCSFFPGKCEGHPGHGKYGPTIHVQEDDAA
jgi:DNA modification methylase